MNNISYSARLTVARSGLILGIAGCILPALLWLAAGDFWLSAGSAALCQAGAIALGRLGWHQPSGKFVVAFSGVLLTLLVAFVAIVLFLAWSAEHGAPL